MENKDKTITFSEFKSWLTGLIVAKKGALPDLEDWKEIKNQLDNVRPDIEFIGPSNPPEPSPWPDYKSPLTERFVQHRYTWAHNTRPYDGVGNYTTNTNATEEKALTMKQLDLAIEQVQEILNTEKK